MTELGRPPVAELRALTSLRGIAAWWVVLYHIRLSIGALSPFWLAVFAKGYLAVDFFFLLSGFVIWLTWHDRLRDGGAILEFFCKRVARVWPLHLLVLGALVAVAGGLAMMGRHDDTAFPWSQLPLHIFLVQDWDRTNWLAWNSPSWSISAELLAYLLFPVMALVVDWKRLPAVVIVITICGALLALHAVMADAFAPTLGWDIARFGMLRCVCEFFAGTGLAALWLRWHTRPAIAAVASVVMGTVLLALWASGIGSETLLVPSGFAGLLLAAALTSGAPKNPLEWRPLHYLGHISYATYLSHSLLFFLFKLAFISRPGGMTAWLAALFIAIVFAASVALYHGFERPAQRWVLALARRPARLTPPLRSPAHPEARR